jgi:hypothetical protein
MHGLNLFVRFSNVCHSPTRRSNPALTCNKNEDDVTSMLVALDKIYPSNYSNIYEEAPPAEQHFSFPVDNSSY